MKYICEKCGAFYDAWDGHCDCENDYSSNENIQESEGKHYERSLCISSINGGNE